MYRIVANLVVLSHAAFVAFVIAGGQLVAVWPALAWLHIPCVVYGIVIVIVGWRCPLTHAEKRLRLLSGQETYSSDFLYHYLWSRVGLSGNELLLKVSVLAGIIFFSLLPYLYLAAAWRDSG